MATLLDGYSESHQNEFWSLKAVHPSSSYDKSAWGHSFQVLGTKPKYKLTQVKFYLSRIGAITGHLVAVLYNKTGEHGSDAIPTGAPLATSDVVDMATVPNTTWGLIAFNFSGDQQYEMSKDAIYCIELQVLDSPNAGGYNAILVGYDDAVAHPDGATHAGNDSLYWLDYWGCPTPSDKLDICFYVYGEFVPSANVTLTVSDGANGTIYPSAGVYTYTQYTYSDVFTATPNDGYIFSYWIVDGTEHISANPFNVYMDANHTLQPYFSVYSPPAGDWQTPDAIESSTGWTNPAYSKDDNIATYATAPAVSGYTNFIIFTHSALASEKLRFYSHYASSDCKIDVDVYNPDSDAWTDVYEGTFANNVWVEKTFTLQKVTKMRIRFYEYGYACWLYEVDFNGYAPAPPPLLAKALGSHLAYLLTGNDKGKIVILT